MASKETRQEFRNVALMLDTHGRIKEIADAEQRTIARQLKIIIEREHAKYFGPEDDDYN
jgi:D-serine deaminase-like pyridoxal phosphate-dependent protein|tara:strand:- start:269 stop:445 length:177 start_codon:yes stop_codon:yes gene_type:complete